MPEKRRATPATAAAARAGVDFAVHAFAHDPNAESFGLEAAAALGVDPARVFKTLVAAVDGRPVLAVVPVTARLNLKALAAAAGGKHAEMAEPHAAERATGYVVAAVDGRPVLAVVPVTARLNLKALAAAAGGKHAEMAEPHAAERATGYVVGGISPLGVRRSLPVLVDASALLHGTVFVSAGRRGLDIELAPADLARLTGAAVAPLAG